MLERIARARPNRSRGGLGIVDLLDFELRAEEAHRLGMRLFEVEPDPRDRARLLLEMSRLDIDRIAPGSVVQFFEPVWRQHPEHLGLALAAAGETGELRRADGSLTDYRNALEKLRPVYVQAQTSRRSGSSRGRSFTTGWRN